MTPLASIASSLFGIATPSLQKQTEPEGAAPASELQAQAFLPVLMQLVAKLEVPKSIQQQNAAENPEQETVVAEEASAETTQDEPAVDSVEAEVNPILLPMSEMIASAVLQKLAAIAQPESEADAPVENRSVSTDVMTKQPVSIVSQAQPMLAIESKALEGSGPAEPAATASASTSVEQEKATPIIKTETVAPTLQPIPQQSKSEITSVVPEQRIESNVPTDVKFAEPGVSPASTDQSKMPSASQNEPVRSATAPTQSAERQTVSEHSEGKRRTVASLTNDAAVHVSASVPSAAKAEPTSHQLLTKLDAGNSLDAPAPIKFVAQNREVAQSHAGQFDRMANEMILRQKFPATPEQTATLESVNALVEPKIPQTKKPVKVAEGSAEKLSIQVADVEQSKPVVRQANTAASNNDESPASKQNTQSEPIKNESVPEEPLVSTKTVKSDEKPSESAAKDIKKPFSAIEPVQHIQQKNAVQGAVQEPRVTAVDSKPEAVTPAKVVEQIIKEIPAAFDKSGGEVKVKLTPQSLGEVTLNVRMENATVVATIDVTQASVKNVVESQLPQLREALAKNGVEVTSIEVMIAGQALSDQSQSRQSSASQQSRGLKRRIQIDDPELAAAAKQLGYNTLEFIA